MRHQDTGDFSDKIKPMGPDLFELDHRENLTGNWAFIQDSPSVPRSIEPDPMDHMEHKTIGIGGRRSLIVPANSSLFSNEPLSKTDFHCYSITTKVCASIRFECGLARCLRNGNA